MGVTRRFPRAARVRTRAEYDRIFQHGRRVALPVLALHWRPAFMPPIVDVAEPASMSSAPPVADARLSLPDAQVPPSGAAQRLSDPAGTEPLASTAPGSSAGGQARPARRAAETRHRTARIDIPPPAPPALDAGARLGLAVSRKVDRRAVVRNRIKRGLRETFRAHRAALAPGEYVVVARPGAAALAADALQRTLLTLLRRAGALPPDPPAGTMPAAACTDPVQPPSR